MKSLRDSLLKLAEGARNPGIVMNLGLALYPVSTPPRATGASQTEAN